MTNDYDYDYLLTGRPILMAMLAKSMANVMQVTTVKSMTIVIVMTMVLMVMMVIAGNTMGVVKVEAPGPLNPDSLSRAS